MNIAPQHNNSEAGKSLLEVPRALSKGNVLARSKPQVEVKSFGIYTQWESESKELPRVVEFTRQIPAVVDIEFGIVVNIKKAKNELINFCIHHPGIKDEAGKVRAPFDGQVYAKTNDWDFFLGDTIWLPIEDKLGPWQLTIEIAGRQLVDETLQIVAPE